MGEISQSIGKKLEGFGSELFSQLNWEVLAKDLSIDCSRQSHKSFSSQTGKKQTHGIDIMLGFENPFTRRKEAVIVECKNHKWSDFIPSNLNIWIEELVNTIECAASSPKVAPFLRDYVLTTGILLFNSSDNSYDAQRALDNIAKVKLPRRRNPLMIYLADPSKIDKWLSITKEIAKIKLENSGHNFGLIYPSIGGSNWQRMPTITPSYLFSDYIIATYAASKKIYGDTKRVDIKAIFSFDKPSEDSMLYLKSMINRLQLEAYSDHQQELHVYFYPDSSDEIELIKEYFSRILGKDKENYKCLLLNNRHLAPVDYGKGGA
jgi:hypothetical protein